MRPRDKSDPSIRLVASKRDGAKNVRPPSLALFGAKIQGPREACAASGIRFSCVCNSRVYICMCIYMVNGKPCAAHRRSRNRSLTCNLARFSLPLFPEWASHPRVDMCARCDPPSRPMPEILRLASLLSMRGCVILVDLRRVYFTSWPTCRSIFEMPSRLI